MHQLVLAIVGISLAAILSFALTERTVAYSIDRDWAENNRRLDIAALAVQRSMRDLTGTQAPSPPPPDNASVSGFKPGFGTFNQTVAGVPFLYCPIGAASISEASALGATGMTVRMGDGRSYTAYVQGNAVLRSDLALHSSWANGNRPLAFIVAAGRNEATPPSCENVRQVGGKAVVEGGLARAVFSPVDPSQPANTAIRADSGVTTFWVTATGKGTGRTSGSATSIDAAMSHYLLYKPERFEIRVNGHVTASADLFAAFSSLVDHAGHLTIRGAGLNNSITVGVDTMNTARETVLYAVSIIGPNIRVDGGDQLTVLGAVSLDLDPAFGISYGIVLSDHSRLVLKSATLRVDIESGGRGIVRQSNSDILMFDSTMLPVKPNIQNLIYATGESNTYMVDSQLGTPDAANRPTIASIQHNADGLFTADAASRAYRAPSRYCWYSQSDFGALAPKLIEAYTGAGSSKLKGYQQQPQPPGPGATQSDIDYYEAWRRRLWIARQNNLSDATCFE